MDEFRPIKTDDFYHLLRDITQKINGLLTTTLELLGGSTSATTFLETIRREKGRYVREQFGLMQKLAQKYCPDLVARELTTAKANGG